MKNRKKTKKWLQLFLSIALYILVGAGVFLPVATLAGGNTTPSRWDANTSASEIFDKVVGDANLWKNTSQETALDDVSADYKNWWFASKYRIANTLGSISNNISPYLQWLLYAWITIATILIIITGIQLVTSPQSSYDTKKAISKIKNIVIGILVMTGVYFLLKLFMIVVKFLLQ